MKTLLKTPFSTYAFMLLFAAEFTYYLLILQTGIVEYHHSNLTEIWMVPAGGMIGILLSILVYKDRQWLISFLLFSQLLLSIDYAKANGLELFLLGFISGLTAPMLIAGVQRLWIVVVALALSYAFGTYVFDVQAVDRTGIALGLSLFAFATSLFSGMNTVRDAKGMVSLYSMGNIFLWLLLDAALFETLSRNTVMHLWGEDHFIWMIILFHLIGLAVAYRLRHWKYNDAALLGLFILTYVTYTLGSQEGLSVVYPFVISYYNVIILSKLIRLPYVQLALMSLSLWAASGLGLFIALSHTFAIAWAVLALLIWNFWNKRGTLKLPVGSFILPKSTANIH
ncbi:hypothetical protein [Sulfurovum sp. NBC37-1]|uniref:hypothetical protein n=1 Tax=Sulfurovum sp. (strain NBC37-1) TaxID=387093 RepID=UPI00015878D1|nr:hypothetical protein [Sulfurovum sp. NBC37-1]BAF72026.1 hypothetical protein SUN_1069 [Sulfurovum sp. NBC37-1]